MAMTTMMVMMIRSDGSSVPFRWRSKIIMKRNGVHWTTILPARTFISLQSYVHGHRQPHTKSSWWSWCRHHQMNGATKWKKEEKGVEYFMTSFYFGLCVWAMCVSHTHNSTHSFLFMSNNIPFFSSSASSFGSTFYVCVPLYGMFRRRLPSSQRAQITQSEAYTAHTEGQRARECGEWRWGKEKGKTRNMYSIWFSSHILGVRRLALDLRLVRWKCFYDICFVFSFLLLLFYDICVHNVIHIS